MLEYRKYIPIVLFLSMGIKTLIFELNFASIGALLVFALYAGYLEYRGDRKQTDKLSKEMIDLRESLEKLRFQHQTLESEFKNFAGSTRVSQSLKKA